MSRRRLRQLVTVVGTIVLAAVAAWLQHEEKAHDSRSSRPGRSPTPAATSAWTELKSPTLTGDRADDGDSFLVAHEDGRHLLRLYFVDAPETRRHQFNGDRLADQGAAFGGLTEPDTLRIGREARAFTLHLLRTYPFRAFTRWEPVYDDRRHYAHIAISQPDGTQRWLAEMLVEAGLVRIHTKGADLPDATPRREFEFHLRSLEKSARLAGRGGWADFAARDATRR